jgi:hypothetical protein
MRLNDRSRICATGEQGHQDFVDDHVLADDDLADLAEDQFAAGGDALGDCGDVPRRERRGMHQCVSE